MKTKMTKLLILSFALILLNACGTSKSNQTPTTQGAPTVLPVSPGTGPITVDSTNQKLLTSCQSTSSTAMQIQLATIFNQYGVADFNWTKIKFNFISSETSASGNRIQFFKWKVSGTQAVLDPTPLNFMFYNYSTRQPTTELVASALASDINLEHGLYVQLNDAQAAYQVLKIVVYNSNNQVVSQMNTLIPQFYATPQDYALNSDGSARAQILKDLHPLKSTDTTNWTTANYEQFYANLCF